MQGNNANYIDYMYESWKKDPKSVNASWQAYFTTEDFAPVPTLGQRPRDAQLDEILNLIKKGGVGIATNTVEAAIEADDSIRLFRLCRAYMSYGHLIANLDPLELKKHYKDSPSMTKKFNFPTEEILKILDYKSYGFTEADLEKSYNFKIPFSGAISEK